MVLHLEAGTCDAGVGGSDIVDLAFECYQSAKYTTDDDADYDFQCPTCEAQFDYMSALLQHAESDSCDEKLEIGSLAKFLRFLDSRI
jgi:hypothetical protein